MNLGKMNLGKSWGLNDLLNTLASPFNIQFQESSALRQFTPCPHGPGCPQCLEERKNEAHQLQKLDEERKAKKADYENRCKEYLKKFREKG